MGSKEGAFYCGRLSASSENYEDAGRWFHQAARQEYGPALLWLGLMNLRGLGAAPNLPKGIEYLERGSRAGNLLAQRELAIQMVRGRLGPLKVFAGVFLLAYSVLAGLLEAVRNPYSDRVTG